MTADNVSMMTRGSAEVSTALQVMTAPLRGYSYGIDHFDGDVSLGRSKQCDIYISDRETNEEHANLRLDGGHWRVHGVDGAQVLVNDEPSSSRWLRDGDVLTIGRTQLRFCLQEAKKTKVVLPGTDIEVSDSSIAGFVALSAAAALLVIGSSVLALGL